MEPRVYHHILRYSLAVICASFVATALQFWLT